MVRLASVVGRNFFRLKNFALELRMHRGLKAVVASPLLYAGMIPTGQELVFVEKSWMD